MKRANKSVKMRRLKKGMTKKNHNPWKSLKK